MAVKYCRPGLATGANNGLTFANAWQSFADMNTNMTAGDEIWIPYGTYTGSTLNVTQAGTAYNNRIIIRACKTDGSAACSLYDILVNDEWIIIDGESSLTNCVSVNGGSFVSCMGVDVVNATAEGWNFHTTTSNGFCMEACGGSSCGGKLVEAKTYTRGLKVIGGKYRNNTATGIESSVEGATIEFAYFVNIPRAVSTSKYTKVHSNVFDACGGGSRALVLGSTANVATNNVFYNCENCIYLATDYMKIERNRFADNTGTCVYVASFADKGIQLSFNAYYNNTTKLTIDGVVCDSLHEKDMTSHGMIDPANGNYMSDPATDEAWNIENNIDSINSAYTTAGLPPEITSGGGGPGRQRPWRFW
jgi:hypothetical protein